MKDLDLSNAEGLDESITENYSGFIMPNKYIIYVLKYKAGTAFTDAEKYDILRIENSPNVMERNAAVRARSGNGITAPSLILEKLIAPIAPATAPSAPTMPQVTNDTLPSIEIGANIKSVVKSIPLSKPLRGLEKEEKAKAELKEEPKEEPKAEPKEEPAKETKKDVSKSVEDKTETDKILGMPKMVAIGLGVVILAIGGFIAYKKFKK